MIQDFILKNITPYPSLISSPIEAEDIRVGNVIQSQITEKTRFILVGFPFDKGVRNNGGKPGARFSPNAIRCVFYKYVAHQNTDFSFIADIGNLNVADLQTAEAQELLGKFIALCLKNNLFPIVLGGGHETSFGHFLGYAKETKSIQIINFDAHTDVRELRENLPHSGSPFYQAIHHPSNVLHSYHVLGAQQTSVSQIHSDRVLSCGSIQYRNQTLKLPTLHSSVLVTIDLDVFDQSIMSGVSAPNANGLSFDEVWKPIKALIESKKITSIDIVELNPLLDRNETSTRFAAFLLWNIFSELLA